ncbi:polyhydroxyalkanoate synthesis regulator DNA-binding domain-containing protein [Streptomyces sp. NPDC055037]|uniref:polyhydroxyalkanoate synthesis regulator DNA-binding domain-containing protein n=1 Tax=Streptomyces sp. NPDC059569 TaxID=3346869 RepID=UPI0036D02AF4
MTVRAGTGTGTGTDGASLNPPTGTGAERHLVRTEGGQLFDTFMCRPVTVEELADDVRRGRRFRVREGESGGECTYQVLAQVLLTALAPAAPVAARAVGRSSGMAGPLSEAAGDDSPPGRSG